jgi:hypothetical protein
MYFNKFQTVTLPPLDTGLLLAGGVSPDTPGAGGTHELLSLIMEANRSANRDFSGHPWPLYIQLTTNYDAGAGVGVYVRERSGGNNWETGFHVENFPQGGGTKIGYNAEMYKKNPAARVIGVNLQAKTETRGNQTPARLNEAINIQSDPGTGWETGIKFDGTTVADGIRFTEASHGQRAIAVRGNYGVSLDAGKAPIRLDAGTPIELDGSGKIRMVYDPKTMRILFLNGDTVLAYIDVHKASNKALN